MVEIDGSEIRGIIILMAFPKYDSVWYYFSHLIALGKKY